MALALMVRDGARAPPHHEDCGARTRGPPAEAPNPDGRPAAISAKAAPVCARVAPETMARISGKGRQHPRLGAGNSGRIRMQFRVSPKTLSECSAAEWQARIDLAAAHRLAYMHDFSEGIFNHLTLVVPGRTDRYYQIPFGTHWSEVTASTFMEVGIDDGEVKHGTGDVERSCYCIHAPIHKALPQAKAVFHTHMPYASALTRLEDPRIKEIGQTEVGMSAKIAYDDEYTGPAFDPAEGARLARVIGDKSILFMANHGISTVGETVADAYDRLYYIERAAPVQIYAMWTGQPLKKLPDAVVEKTQRTIGGDSLYNPGPAQRHFDALKRIL